MKLQRINEHTIRCILTGEEIRTAGLGPAQIAGNTEEALRILHELVWEEARRQNFPLNEKYNCIRVEMLSNGEVSITMAENSLPISQEEMAALAEKGGENWLSDLLQGLMPAEPGEKTGVDGIIERIGQLMDSAAEEENSAPEEGEKDAPAAEGAPAAGEGQLAGTVREYGYVFGSMDDVIACARTVDRSALVSSSLYQGEYDYYLFLEGREMSGAAFEKTALFMTEFGNLLEEPREGIASIKEHSRLILKGNAVDVLGSL